MDHNKRNFILLFCDSVLFVNAMTFLSINAVITYFLSELGASTFEIGLANALVSIGAFVSQPVFAKQVMNLPYKLMTFVKLLLTQRIFFLIFVFTIPLFAESNPKLMVLLFLICWAIFSIFVGAYVPFYISLFAKMVAVQQRGRLRGYSGAVGNLLALGAAFITGILLKEIAFPYNYTIIFALGLLFLMLDVLVFYLMKEQPDQVTKVDINYIQYYKAIPSILRENDKFRKIVLSFSFIVISQVSMAYYVLYAVREFDINAAQIALFTAITGFVNIIGNIIFGIIADRYSHRLILVLASAMGGLAGLIVLGIHELYAVYIAFGLTNLCMSGYNLSSGILIIENVEKEKLGMFVSVNNMITLVISSVVMIGGSFLVDHLSFASIFWIAALSGSIGCIPLIYFQRGKMEQGTERAAD